MPRRSKTPGVRVVRRQRGDGVTWYGRVQDPITKKWRDENLTKQGLTTEELRAHWKRSTSDRLLALRRAVSLGTVVTPIDDAVKRYLADCAGRELRPRTLAAYRRSLSHFSLWLGARGRVDIQSATGADIHEYRLHVIQAHRAPLPVQGRHSRAFVPAAGRAGRPRRRDRVPPDRGRDARRDRAGGQVTATAQTLTLFMISWDPPRGEDGRAVDGPRSPKVLARTITIRERSSAWDCLPLDCYESLESAARNGWHKSAEAAIAAEIADMRAESRENERREEALMRLEVKRLRGAGAMSDASCMKRDVPRK